ncbi:hypothetical protein ACTV1M_003728 [Cronobacter dublinensis]
MEENKQLQEVVAHISPARDVALGNLVMVANMGARFSVTLIVDGQLVFGDLISGKDYCDEMYNSFSKAGGDNTLGEAVGGFFLKLKKDYYSPENDAEAPLNFIHLNNVSYMKGDGGQLNMQGSILRVCVDKVSAFSVGRPT